MLNVVFLRLIPRCIIRRVSRLDERKSSDGEIRRETRKKRERGLIKGERFLNNNIVILGLFPARENTSIVVS